MDKQTKALFEETGLLQAYNALYERATQIQAEQGAMWPGTITVTVEKLTVTLHLKEAHGASAVYKTEQTYLANLGRAWCVEIAHKDDRSGSVFKLWGWCVMVAQHECTNNGIVAQVKHFVELTKEYFAPSPFESVDAPELAIGRERTQCTEARFDAKDNEWQLTYNVLHAQCCCVRVQLKLYPLTAEADIPG